MTFGAALVLLCAVWCASAGDPVFDPSTLMRLVLVPADAAVGSVIYRVRASDPDFEYPLHFELIGKDSTITTIIGVTLNSDFVGILESCIIRPNQTPR